LKRLISDIILRSYHKCSNCCPFTRTQGQKRLLHSSGTCDVWVSASRHQRSSRLTTGRPTASTSTLSTTAFGAVYSIMYTRRRWKMWINWSSAWSRSGLVCSRPLSMRKSTNGDVSGRVSEWRGSSLNIYCTCNFWVWCRFNSSNFVNIVMFNDLKFRDLRCFVGVLPCSCLCCGWHRKTSAGTLLLTFITK